MGRTGRARLRKKRTINANITKEDTFSALQQQLGMLGWRNAYALTARNFPSTGRGICSKTQNFCAGDRLISLPLKCLVTICTLEESSHFKSQFDTKKFHKDLKIPFQALLALYVLHEQHLEEASHINAYIKSIPKQFSTPYFCTIAELQRLPEEILEKTVAQNRVIRESYACLKNIFHNNKCCYCGKQYFDDIYTLTAYKWAYFAVNTRSVYVLSRQIKPEKCFFQTILTDEPNMALAPFLDLFNHSSDVQTNADLLPIGPNKQLEYVLTLESTKLASAIPPRKQLFISYGTLSNYTLLTEYGFFISHNPDDYFSFSLTDIEEFLKQDKTYSNIMLHRNKFTFIRAHNLHDEMFVHLEDGASHNLCVVLHLLLHEQSIYPNVLNQVAFGSAERLANVEAEIRSLVGYKINSYKRFVHDLEQLTALSESGVVAKGYLEECIRFLNDYLDKAA
ncbi:SET domain-containing protein 4 [Ceratitis capitata]|uniref:SET domain-containing protein 4 n=1 Tax=Ceratitis capitata TaxID=7213 RepID=W8B5H8_CERCA|nr:SET domain-containing protein 4 [Ceratitis capitata]